jgi:hypothetical protein
MKNCTVVNLVPMVTPMVKGVAITVVPAVNLPQEKTGVRLRHLGHSTALLGSVILAPWRLGFCKDNLRQGQLQA